MACTIDFADLPLLNGCPGDNEWFLVGNAAGGLDPNGNYTTGYGRRTYLNLAQCIFSKLFAEGIFPVAGTDLSGSNIFIHASWDGLNLQVFYNGAARFLTYNPSAPTYPSSEWIPVLGGGIQILIPGTFTSADIFTVFPNGLQ